MLAEVWQAIDTLASSKKKTRITLPRLKGAGGGKNFQNDGG